MRSRRDGSPPAEPRLLRTAIDERRARITGVGRSDRRGPRSASASVNRPARSALPAIAPSHPRSRSASRSSIEATPPAASTGRPTGERRRAGRGRARERAVAPCSSRAAAGRPPSAHARRARRRSRRSPRPAVDRDAPVADVDRNDEPRAEAPRRSLRGTRASRAAVPTITRRRPPSRAAVDAVECAVAATDLHREPAAAATRSTSSSVGRAREGTVEVDEVERRAPSAA